MTAALPIAPRAAAAARIDELRRTRVLPFLTAVGQLSVLPLAVHYVIDQAGVAEGEF